MGDSFSRNTWVREHEMPAAKFVCDDCGDRIDGTRIRVFGNDGDSFDFNVCWICAAAHSGDRGYEDWVAELTAKQTLRATAPDAQP